MLNRCLPSPTFIPDLDPATESFFALQIRLPKMAHPNYSQTSHGELSHLEDLAGYIPEGYRLVCSFTSAEAL